MNGAYVINLDDNSNKGKSDSNRIRNNHHLISKRTLNKLAKWLSVRLRTRW